MPEGLHREWFGKEIHVVGVRELFGFRFFRRIGQLCCARVVGCLGRGTVMLAHAALTTPFPIPDHFDLEVEI